MLGLHGALALALTASSPAIASSADRDAAEALVASAKFRIAKSAIASGYERIVAEMTELTQVPAPPFAEKRRGELYRHLLEEAGLADVQTDAAGNVFGFRPGSEKGKLIVVAAHLDTVFPADTEVAVTRRDNKLYAPGIADDGASLAVLLAYARALDAAKIRTRTGIVFVGTVGEEGGGNLRGVRHLFQEGPLKDRIAAFVSFEPDRAGEITNGGVGSKRYDVTFTGPGGHSYEDFGLVNPAYAMADAIKRIGAIPLPKDPKTTINVGLIAGGTSINSIPGATTMGIDIRSEDAEALRQADAAFHAVLEPAVSAENKARSRRAGSITYEAERVGDRPVGKTAQDSRIVRIATAAAQAADFSVSYSASSTDSNLPMSLEFRP